MLSRTIVFLASTVAALGFSACSSTYSDVYSFKRSRFVPPPQKTATVVPPTETVDPFLNQPTQMAPESGIPGVPGVPSMDPGVQPIPGLESPPVAPPEPAADPGAIPAL